MQACGRIHDTWKWESVYGHAAGRSCARGLIRVDASLAKSVLNASGKQYDDARWFLENVSNKQDLGIPRLGTDWIEAKAKETWDTYAAYVGKLNVGRRPATTEDFERSKYVRKIWRVSSTPRQWSYEQVEEFIQQSDFTNIEILERRP